METYLELYAMATVEASVPPLVDGDRMTLEEFLRRCEAIPELKRAELIDGVVYMPSPTSVDHGDSDFDITGWMYHYRARTPGCKGGSNSTTIIAKSATQPDDHLRLLPEYGGRTRNIKRLMHGGPELVAEVSLSSKSRDLNPKLKLYQKNKVAEYLVILVEEQEIHWHRLKKGKYQMLKPDEDGIYRSIVFSGLWLNGPAFLVGDAERVLTTLDEGMNSQEYIKFVEKLKRNRAK